MSLKHMKSLIVLVVGLLSVGCATVKDIGVQLGGGKPNSTKVEPAKELTQEQKQKTLRDSVIGEYEFKSIDGTTFKFVFLVNGIEEVYSNGEKEEEAKWSIVDGEIHVNFGEGIGCWRINADKSITIIAVMRDGERTDLPKENQYTYKKIK